MAYYSDLFTPETADAFKHSTQDISGFRLRQMGIAKRIKKGDIFICYMTRLSRWFGVLEVIEGPFTDTKPIFFPEDDPFVVRFKVRTHILLDLEKAIPIHENEIWKGLSFTRNHSPETSKWTGKLRGSLVKLDDADGEFLYDRLKAQSKGGKTYPLDEEDSKKLKSHTVALADKTIRVSVPDDTNPIHITERPAEFEVRESIQMQALLARIGAQMNLKIWLPKADRAAVSREWKDESQALLDRLPLNYDDTTLRTIEQIDVLWLKGRSILRAFEVEHTTSVYSGILRMADLLALQPNMAINLHIVAPIERRDKVLTEIRRPVFSLLENRPLSESCTYLSYDSLNELASQEHLTYLRDDVLDEYVEEAE